MDLINIFLNKYKSQLEKSSLFNEKVIFIIKEKTNIVLTNKEFSINNNNLYLKCSPKKKLSILLFKDLILNEINKDSSKAAFIYEIK